MLAKRPGRFRGPGKLEEGQPERRRPGPDTHTTRKPGCARGSRQRQRKENGVAGARASVAAAAAGGLGRRQEGGLAGGCGGGGRAAAATGNGGGRAAAGTRPLRRRSTAPATRRPRPAPRTRTGYRHRRCRQRSSSAHGLIAPQARAQNGGGAVQCACVGAAGAAGADKGRDGWGGRPGDEWRAGEER
ncbi:hypothetical protein GH733_013024 [Mirounga leonina]|nr:hypothetical protein GH733_013024 [Mirounga leonina]